MKTQLQEVSEAINAGENLLWQIDYVERNLRSAKGWGILDMFSDRGFLTAMLKHSKLSEAEEAMNQLRYNLNQFNSELSDIHISDNVSHITMSNGMQFADWFFDGLLVDAMSLSHIGQSQREVQDLRIQVQNALDKLYALKNALEQR